jgi:acyl-CoA thioesterase
MVDPMRPAPASACASAINDDAPTPQQTAERVRDGMLANDRVSRAMGMQVLAIAPGSAMLAMTVRDDMLNGHDICHGGLIATLADSAFAFACNAYGAPTVASGFGIDLLAPARAGDVLTARCHEVSKAGRTGVYDTEVTNQRDERVAVFRGRSHTLRGRLAVASVSVPVSASFSVTETAPRSP